MLVRYAVGEATEKELAASASAKKGTCGQKPAPAIAAREIVGTGPGTEPKRLLAKVGIAVTADCPCNESAALMDSNGGRGANKTSKRSLDAGRVGEARKHVHRIHATEASTSVLFPISKTSTMGWPFRTI